MYFLLEVRGRVYLVLKINLIYNPETISVIFTVGSFFLCNFVTLSVLKRGVYNIIDFYCTQT